MKLYEIPSAYREWLARVEEADGEITDDLAHEFAAIEGELAVKSDHVVGLIKELAADAEAYRKEAADFNAKARAAANRQEWLKTYLLDTLRFMDLGGVRGARFSVTRCKAGTPSIRWPEGREVPAEFARVFVELDGKKAQEAHRHGVLPDDFEVTFTEFLRIK